MPDKKLEQDFKNLSATNDYLEIARQDAIALAESFKRERDQLREAAEKLAEALDKVVPSLLTLSKILKDNALDEKQANAEHDACLIACGFLKGDIEKALADYRKQFPKANE